MIWMIDAPRSRLTPPRGVKGPVPPESQRRSVPRQSLATPGKPFRVLPGDRRNTLPGYRVTAAVPRLRHKHYPAGIDPSSLSRWTVILSLSKISHLL